MANVPTVSHSEATPAGSDYIRDGDDRIREFKTQVREIVAVDHKFDSSGQGATWGMHKWITFIEAADIGTGASGLPILGAQTVDGKPELVYTDEDDNDIQLTSGGLRLGAITDIIAAGFELAYFATDATSVSVKQGVMAHGFTRIRTTAPTALVLDTAGNYYDGNQEDYSTEGWNYIGVAADGTHKLLGKNAADVSSYAADGTQGDATGTPLYFWDSANTIHYRVVGAVRCYEVDGVIKAKWGQLQSGKTVFLDIPQTMTSTSRSTWSDGSTQDLGNCSALIPAISTMGIFTGAAGGTGASYTLVGLSLKPLGFSASYPTGEYAGILSRTNASNPYLHSIAGELWCPTDDSQKISHREYSAAGQSLSIVVKGYVLNIR
ncbi:hypothetical protein LCGC14_0686820 [marine sediment metagenome]|uniref:Uncharacterized protein n=1 Tax=marine sediment metagenome TaxID=412755 RepID=A0A0F9R6X1_9ZZZZ